MNEQFLEWLASDNVVKIGPDLYVEQSSLYRIKMSKDDMYKFFIKEFKL